MDVLREAAAIVVEYPWVGWAAVATAIVVILLWGVKVSSGR